HVKFVVERVAWLYKNRELIGGLKWKNEPRILRFFFGELEAIGNWKENLVEAFKKDFPQGK
ncbi:MAG: tryptophanase, partial [Firmicutes bacterium]|nr:tryptophanase [Bacillota bacterium]